MYKHSGYLFVLFSMIFMSVKAQNIPNGVTNPATATAKILPASYAATPANYLRTYSTNKPIQDSSLVNLSAVVEDVHTNIEYSDTYGRTIEVVTKQASPSKSDNVSTTCYDEFGRSSIMYPAFAAVSGNTNDGKFKTNPFTQDSSFYKGIFPNENIVYSQNLYDGSPLNISVKTIGSGNSWAGSAIGTSFSHRVNTTMDSVVLWTIAITTEDDVPVKTALYLAGTLTIQEITDEKGVKAIKYIDGLGRTILTKTQISPTPATGHAGWLCTYTVYDEMNHLRLVIPPKAVEALNNPTVNWNLVANSAINTSLCYGFYYDSRGRVTMKRIPGKGKSYIAYDLFDRVVMTQDANLRLTNQWAFVKYEGQGRPFRSGVITSSLNKDSIVAQASRSIDYPIVSGTYTIFSETYYDDYNWIATTGAPLNNTLVVTNINSTNFITATNTSPDYAQPIAVSNRIRGSVTGTKKILLNTASYLYNVPLYDDHRRVVQIKETNYSGGTGVFTTQYSFGGKFLRTHLQQQKAGANTQTHTLLTKYSYDHAGRLKSIIKNIDGLADKTVTQNTYDELGHLKSKIIGGGLDSMSYSYNIRGWLTGINKAYVEVAGSSTNYFGEALAYDYGFTNSQLNANIAGVKWKAKGDGIARAYGFTYDNANQLLKADFTQQNEGTTPWVNTTVDFSINNITYDAGGNMLTLRQRGLLIGSSATIDSLNYQYFSGTNQLQKVSDGITDATPLGDFKDTTLTGDDYTYDIKGNISKDYNRHMHTKTNGNGAVYNLLDKPDSICIAGRSTSYYYYDGGGAKLRKQINDYSTGSLIIKNYLYINGFVYLNDTLQYVQQEEGRIRWVKKRDNQSGSIYFAYEYDYFLKDHLGNVRTVLTEGKDTATYAATMESADSAKVQALFSNVYDPVRTVTAKPSGFDTDNTNHYVSKLTGNSVSAGQGGRTGPSLILKVMAGDKVQINTYAYFNTAVQPPVSDNTLLTDLLTTLVSGVTAQSGGKIGIGNAAAVSSSISPNELAALNTREYNSALPKAYLNWVLFDDQFKYVAGNMGGVQVMAGSSKQALVAPLQTMAKNGYLFVYVSNQSSQDVYFDDLIVTHTTGPLVQEQSYYPFGLQMAGISDKAINKLNSQNKFNGGVELEEETNYYNTFFRKYDAQIGRFSGIDCKAEMTSGLNPYQFGNNNPIMYNDPMGDISTGDWNDFLGKLGTGSDLNGFGDYGGTYSGGGGGGFSAFTSSAQSFGWGASYMTANNQWGSHSGWASSFSEAYGSFSASSSDGPQGYNYVNSKFSGGYANSTYTGDEEINAGTRENYYFAGYGNIFDFNAIIDGYGQQQGSVGQPGAAESAIPIWGNGRAAVDDFQTGHWGWGLVHTALTVSDVFLVKSAVTGIAKLAAVGISRFAAEESTTTVYRVFGADARAAGYSWTPVNPNSVSEFRNLAGLPSGGESGVINSAEFMLEGQVNVSDIISIQSATALDGNIGGLTEYIINPANVNLTNFSVLKP